MQSEIRISDIKFRYILAAIVLFHVLFSMKNISMPTIGKFKEEETTIKIKFAPLNKSKDLQQIVETQKSKIETDAEKKFLGKTKNSVDRQTIAKTVASFKEAGYGNSKTSTKDMKQKSASKTQKKSKKISFSDLAVGNDIQKENQLSAARGIKNGNRKKTGLGRSNDFIKDIPLGDFTKLNTQEYEFYGFYHRIKQKLEQFWGRNIQEQAEKMFKSGRHIASDQNLLTSLTITINAKGRIVSVKINSTSGVRELDEAAVQSFNQAGPFPNPPKKMLRNGQAKIEWGLVVNT